MCSGIEIRTLQPSLLKIEKPAKLFQEVNRVLNVAFEQGILKTKPHIIRSLVKLNKGKEFKIEGGVSGAKNFDRIKNLDSPNYLERVDGCWFDFSILGIQSTQSIEIIGFNFEIRFPDHVPVKFLRFDLNPPGHANEKLSMRYHLHPGCDDFRIHAPPMSPIEILNLFLYGFDIPEKQRSSAAPLTQ
jgi:hypothetical protein